MPERSIVIKIGQNDYTVQYPNTGQELEIAILIQKISNGQYENFKLSLFSGFLREAIKVEAIAHFNVLIPKLKVDLSTKSMLEITREQMDIVIKAYEEDFLPWYDAWQAVLSNPKPKEEEKQDQGDK